MTPRHTVALTVAVALALMPLKRSPVLSMTRWRGKPDGERDAVSERVGDCESVCDRDWVSEGVTDRDRDCEGVGDGDVVAVGVPEGVAAAVPLPEPVPLGVVEPLAVAVTEGDVEGDGV